MDTIVHSETCDMDDKISIKEEPLQQSEISTEVQEPHSEAHFEMVPEKNEMICDIKEEVWHFNETTADIKCVLEQPTISYLEPYMNTVLIKTEDIKDEPLGNGTSTEESNGLKNQMSKDLSLESQRISTEDSNLDDKSALYLDVENCDASAKAVHGKNATQDTSIRQESLLSHNATTTDCDQCESQQNTGDETIGLYKCEKCISQNQALLLSIPKPFKCEICGKSFTHKSYAESHALIHSGIRPHKCDLCNKSFTQKAHLHRHTGVHSGTKPFECNICEKRFTQKSDLQRHTLLHTGTKQYKCDQCEKRFARKSGLQVHAFLHSDTKPHKCKHCQKCFTRKSLLEIHTWVHAGTKPFKCATCESCFTQKSDLQRHISLHTEEYKCSVCEKCFTSKSGLLRHSLLHSGIKPYKCDICQKCFTQKSTLQRHIVSFKHKTTQT